MTFRYDDLLTFQLPTTISFLAFEAWLLPSLLMLCDALVRHTTIGMKNDKVGKEV